MFPFTLAASAEMIYDGLDIVQRVEKIAARGLEAELWDTTRHADRVDDLANSSAVIGSITGYVSGNLTEDEGIRAFLDSARATIPVAKKLGTRRLNFHGTGLDPQGLPVAPVQKVTGKMWAKAALTLEKLAELGAEHDVVFTLENLNLAVDHPGTPFASPLDTLALVSAVDAPNLKLNLDLYHAQIGWGNLIETCEKALPYIGEIQVADVPGRCQPGTGEINYRNVAVALKEMGYSQVVAMEAFAKGDTDEALDQFIATFSEV